MCFNDYPRACAQGFERVSPLQGFSLSIDVSTMILLSALFYDFLRGLVSSLQGFSLSIDVSTMILRRNVRRICPCRAFLCLLM